MYIEIGFYRKKNVGFRKTNDSNEIHKEALANVSQLVGHHPITKRLLFLFPVTGCRAQFIGLNPWLGDGGT